MKNHKKLALGFVFCVQYEQVLQLAFKLRREPHFEARVHVDFLAVLVCNPIFIDQHRKIKGRVEGNHGGVPGASTVGNCLVSLGQERSNCVEIGQPGCKLLLEMNWHQYLNVRDWVLTLGVLQTHNNKVALLFLGPTEGHKSLSRKRVSL